MAATGLSADPREYRARLAEQSDDQIDAWAAELMRDVAIRRGVVRVVDGLPDARRGSTSADSNGCSLPAAGRRRSSGGTARPADGPGDRALRARAGDPVAGRRRSRPPDRVPRRELRRARLRLTPARGRRGPGVGARLAGLVRLTHPFPSLLDGLVAARVALVAGAAPAAAVRLGGRDDRPPGRDRGVNDVVDAPRRRRPQAGQADPGRARLARDRPRRRGRAGTVGLALAAAVRGRACCASPSSCSRSARLRPAAEGHGLVVAAVRGRDPDPAGVRLVGAAGQPAALLPRDPPAGGGASPARRWRSRNALADVERDRCGRDLVGRDRLGSGPRSAVARAGWSARRRGLGRSWPLPAPGAPGRDGGGGRCAGRSGGIAVGPGDRARGGWSSRPSATPCSRAVAGGRWRAGPRRLAASRAG